MDGRAKGRAVDKLRGCETANLAKRYMVAAGTEWEMRYDGARCAASGNSSTTFSFRITRS
jgi:hypothetical protein